MPFTPFHFGPAACISLPLNKKLDSPVFLLVNVAIDVEPLAVIHLNLNYPLHGYAHTLLGSAIVGLLCGWGIHAWRTRIAAMMNMFKLDYQPSLKRALVSGVLGGWLHVFLDSMLYTDIRPFYQLSANPFLGLISFPQMYWGCAISFIPAFILYFHFRGKVRTN